ncbi:MAG: hypothetical protein ACIWVG_24040, partial [Gloeotrichia echinulata HAB0833]
MTDTTEVGLLRLDVHLESWQCPIPTFSIFLAAFPSRSCSVPQFNSEQLSVKSLAKHHTNWWKA